jgi:argininosuccinate synthase
MDGVTLIHKLNKIGGDYGIGRVDMVENRVVGLKSREVYEGPAAEIIYQAHDELEKVVLDRATYHYKQKLSNDFADVIYGGLWFGPLRESMQAFVEESQKNVTGDVRVRLSAGAVRITGRKSKFSLYDPGLATYSDEDTFDRAAAEGFLKIYGLSYRTWGAVIGSKK